jgi:hypothetical protein
MVSNSYEVHCEECVHGGDDGACYEEGPCKYQSVEDADNEAHAEYVRLFPKQAAQDAGNHTFGCDSCQSKKEPFCEDCPHTD